MKKKESKRSEGQERERWKRKWEEKKSLGPQGLKEKNEENRAHQKKRGRRREFIEAVVSNWGVQKSIHIPVEWGYRAMAASSVCRAQKHPEIPSKTREMRRTLMSLSTLLSSIFPSFTFARRRIVMLKYVHLFLNQSSIIFNSNSYSQRVKLHYFGLALVMACGSVGQSDHYFGSDWNITTTMGRIALKFFIYLNI